MQTTITIQRNGICLITSQIPELLNSTLAKELSYKKKDAFFIQRNSSWDGIVRLYSSKKQVFNVGLLQKVLGIFDQYSKQYREVSYEIVDKRKFYPHIFMPGGFSDIDLRDYQNEAVDKFLQKRIGVLHMATGSGKTITALACIGLVHMKTLILVHTQELLNQWQVQIKKYLGIDAGIIQGSTFNPKDVTIGMMQSVVNKLSNEYFKTVNFLICDESHHASVDTVMKISRHTPNAIYRLGLSATPIREDLEDMKIEAVCGKIIYHVGIDELVEKGFLVPATIYYVEVGKGIYDDHFLSYASSYNSHIVNNDARNDHVVDIALKEMEEGNVLILCDRLEHIDILYEKFSDEENVYITHGQLLNEERRRVVDILTNKTNNIVISSTIMKEGVSFPNLRCLILACGGKSSVALIQKVGRLLHAFDKSKKAIVYDFIDNAKYLKSHYKKRRKLLENIKSFEVKDYVPIEK